MLWPLQRDVNEFYGNPIGAHGQVSPFWKANNLILVELPYSMTLAWDPHQAVHQVWFHRKCAFEFIECLTKVSKLYTNDELKEHGLTQYGGTFCYRPMKGGHRLSMHAYGAAMDIDPIHNAFGSHHMKMPMDVVKIFEDAGFVWGGRWHHPDGMHFQAARVHE